MFEKEIKIDITKQPAGSVFNVEIKSHSDGSLYTGTMEIIDPKSKKLRFKLRPEERGDEITIEMTELNGKLKEGGPISGSKPVGILRSLVKQEEGWR